jgi:hypothetical protein
VLDHMSEQMESMQQLFTQSDISRSEVDQRMGELVGAVGRLADRMEADTSTGIMIERLAESQERLISALESKSDKEKSQVDAESRMRLRSIDVQVLRILEEMSAGRQETLGDLRADLAALTKAIRQQSSGR